VNTITINIEPGIKYLSESKNIKQLPKNCLFDKGRVGCGGTTLAIESNEPYVIAVPFVSLIENKMFQHSNILGIYEGVKTSTIKNYLKNNSCPIIMVTYDSLPKLGNYITRSEYKLLIDEYHLLFTQYSFRDEAIDKLLQEYQHYKEYCFMTATPLEEEFILDELKDLDIVNAVWEDSSDVTIESIKCLKGVLNTTIDLINDYLADIKHNKEGNLYLFVNSVKFIKELISNTDVNFQNCNVIFSKNNKTDVGLDRGILPSDKLGTVKPKKINFLTSTVFEGTDIYDEEGKIYIVSDPSKSNTLVDISTSFQQIAGRIRNSKYRNLISHIYSNTRYTSLSYQDFKDLSVREIELAKKSTEAFNAIQKETRTYLIEAGLGKINQTYITVKKDSEIYFNPNLVKLDIYNYKVSKHLYKIRVNNSADTSTSNLTKECTKYNYNVINFEHKSEIKISPTDLPGFKDVVIMLKELQNGTDEESNAYRKAAYLRFSFLENAIEKLTFEGIEKLNYVQTNVKRKLISLLDSNLETKIFKLLKSNSKISSGNFISYKDLKDEFTKIYSELNINKTAKSTDIKSFFNVQTIKKYINKKQEDGVIIINPKPIINL
jgi:hypothetical protein